MQWCEVKIFVFEWLMIDVVIKKCLVFILLLNFKVVIGVDFDVGVLIVEVNDQVLLVIFEYLIIIKNLMGCLQGGVMFGCICVINEVLLQIVVFVWLGLLVVGLLIVEFGIFVNYDVIDMIDLNCLLSWIESESLYICVILLCDDFNLCDFDWLIIICVM